MRTILRRRLILMPLALALALLAGALGPGRAFAGLTACDTDPAIQFSNGTILILDAHTLDTLSDIQGVSYVVHVPQSSTVTGTIYDQYAYLEAVRVVADQPAYTYRVETTVATQANPAAPVTVFAAIIGGGCWQWPQSTPGSANSTLVTSFNCGA